MPYNFKDNGSHIIKPLQRKIYFTIGMLFVSHPIISFLVFGQIDTMQIIDAILGGFMIWGVNFNGFYRLARRYAEWQIKKKDNKWR